MRELRVDPARVNVNGGAIALGHPIGASGARVLTTLIYALRARKLRYGVASLCIGGGMGIAMAVEALIARSPRAARARRVAAHARDDAAGRVLRRADRPRRTRSSKPSAPRNLSDDPNRFLLDPKDHIDARRAARARGLEVVGFYHSHPHSEPEPSIADLAEATYPGYLYLIVRPLAEGAKVRLVRFDELRVGRLRGGSADRASAMRG